MSTTLTEIEMNVKSLTEKASGLKEEIDKTHYTLERLKHSMRDIKLKIKENNDLIKNKLYHSIKEFEVNDIITFNFNGDIKIGGNISLHKNKTIKIIKVNNKSVIIKFKGSKYDHNHGVYGGWVKGKTFTRNVTKDLLKKSILKYNDNSGVKTMIKREEELEKLIK